MIFLRAIARGLLLLIVVVSLTAWIGASTLQMTVLNRQQIKDWLSQSGAYDNLLGSLVNVEYEQTDNESLLEEATLKTALEKTFPPNYIQTETERVLDTSYDWLEGEKQAITFTIHTEAKRDEFITHLTAALQPKLAALPVCTTQSQLALQTADCIPPTTTPHIVAASVAKQAASESPLFTEPITEQSFGITPTAGTQPPAWLHMAVAYVPLAAIFLPLAVVVAAALYALLSSSWLKGVGVIGRRVFFSALLIAIGGGLMWYFGRSLGSGGDTLGLGGGSLVDGIIGPLLQVIVPGTGQWLLIFSSIPAVIGGGVWLTAWLIRRKKQERIRAASVYVPVAPAAPPPPSHPAGTLPPPAQPPSEPKDKLKL